MFSVSDNGSLAVIWETRDARDLDRALKRLDERLFIDPEHDGHQLFYTVKFFNGERAPEQVSMVLDWRSPDGTPKPLTEQLVGEVERMMRRGPIDVKKITEQNRRLQETRRAEQLEGYAEIMADFERHDRRTHAVHRSTGLRMARDRMRRRGENV